MRLTEEARNLDLADRYLNAHSSKYMIKAGEIDKAHETMLLFSKEIDGDKLNVHEMAQNWFEWHCARAFMRQKDYRKSLKQLDYMVGHVENMQKDIVDFFWCAMKRVNMATYCESQETRENIHQGKWPVKACIELLRLLARMRRDVDV